MSEVIRAEVPADHAAVRALNLAAFGRPGEARLVDVLRSQARPIVSLVAQVNGETVGHILFSPVTLSGEDGLLMGLAPMAVAPGRQRSGIGSRLVRTGLAQCRRLGAQAVVVLGHPEFYPRFGFVPAEHFALHCEYDVPTEAFMAIELHPGALRRVSGTVCYHAAFAAL